MRVIPLLLFTALLTTGRANDALTGSEAKSDDISLWIDEKQVKQFFNGFPLRIYAILDAHVLPYVLDPNLEQHLPVIPVTVNAVNFTWRASQNRYRYHFFELASLDQHVLHAPILSIPSEGHVPQGRAQEFQVLIACVGNASGIARFTLGLRIWDSTSGQNLRGTPLRLRLQKQCVDRSTPDPECDQKCGKGTCDQDKICQCPAGFLGQFCESALCYPQCMNGGTCVAPGVCACAHGFQGFHCEGGICREKCLNGGKCVQKDTCACRRGYYGPRCEYSKCAIPCLNGGRCVGVNRCRCRRGFRGSQCEQNVLESDPKNSSPKQKKSRKKFV